MNEGSYFWKINNNDLKLNLTENIEIPSGNKVYIDCHEGYKIELTKGQNIPSEQKFSVCRRGTWDPVFMCKPSKYIYIHG